MSKWKIVRVRVDMDRGGAGRAHGECAGCHKQVEIMVPGAVIGPTPLKCPECGHVNTIDVGA